MKGFIKLHRSLLKWEWFSEPNMLSVWLYLLLKATHEPTRWKGVDVDTGQLIFGRKEASKTLGISEQSIRTCITRLKSTSEITTKSTNKFSLVTIVKWADYQSNEKKSTSKSTNKLTNHQPTTNQQLTTFKKDNTNVLSKEGTLSAQRGQSNLHPLQYYIQENHPQVCKMRNQLTFSQSENLVTKFSKEEIKDVLNGMENKADLLKKYTSVNLTIQSWIKLRKAKSPEISTDKKYEKETDIYSEFQKY